MRNALDTSSCFSSVSIYKQSCKAALPAGVETAAIVLPFCLKPTFSCS